MADTNTPTTSTETTNSDTTDRDATTEFPSDDEARSVLERLKALLDEHDPSTESAQEFRGHQYDAGLAWVHHEPHAGGMGARPDLQSHVERHLHAAGLSIRRPVEFFVYLAGPTIATHGTEEQCDRLLRPMFTGEELWCQLFSEPGAGSDFAGLAASAVRDGDEWVVNGQKVWNTLAHLADRGMLVTRSDPNAPKHKGMTYFALDMRAPGVEVRPLRQITGEAEFNEVFLTDVRIPDAHRLGEPGQGWQVANFTLNNERVAIGGSAQPREGRLVGVVAEVWRTRPELRTADLHERLLRLWVEAEVARLTGERLRQKLARGVPGPEGAAMKLSFARINQQLTGLELELLGEDGLRYSDWTMVQPEQVDFTGRDAGYRSLRAKGNSIEGGTSEILRNIVAERVLGLPAETRVDKDVPFRELSR
ncbi:MAG: acyl-CoA dehydrogenase family protein [Microthrixaceae bacterium]